MPKHRAQAAGCAATPPSLKRHPRERMSANRRTWTGAAVVSLSVAALTAAVVDGSRAGAASADVTTVTAKATEDSYVNLQQPTVPQGAKSYVFGTTDTNQGFVKFNTASVVPTGSSVVSASLNLYITNNSVLTEGVAVHPAESDWSEQSLVLANRPAFQPAVLNDPTAPRAGGWTSIPLKSMDAIHVSGTTSLEIRYTASGSSFQFSSLQSANPPKLELQISRPTPTATATAPPSTPVSTLASPTRTDPATSIAATGTSTSPVATSPPASVSTTNAPSPSNTSASSSAAPTSTRSTDPTNPAPSTSAPPATSSGVLPFDLPAKSAGRKLVFAHYFTPYPISLDNKDGSNDYYQTGYLDPKGEGGSHAAYGGLLRDRPLPRGVLSGNYQLADAETEVRQAMSDGLDGFSLDLLSRYGAGQWNRDLLMYDAAALVSPNFKIMAMPDMNGLASVDSETLAKMLATLAAKPSAFKLADGRLVVSPFKGEGRTPDWWTTTFNVLKSEYGVSVAFVPTFVNFNAAPAYKSISYGYSVWGGANTAAVSNAAGNATKAAGLKWMQPVRVQDERPNQGIYDEAGNLATLRASWQAAFDTDADWVQIPTWNDYSEGASIAPSVHHGWTFLDLNAYFVAKFESGSYPSVQRDALYATHRTQFANAMPVFPQTSLMHLRGGSSPSTDQVEVTSFLTDAATVTATVGGNVYSWVAPGGVSTHTVPLGLGVVAVKAVRNGVTVQSVTSPYAVTATPAVQDLQYVGVSSRR